MYKFLCGHMFSVLGGRYLGVELLDHGVTVCVTFRKTAKLFSKVVSPFPILISNETQISPCLRQHLPLSTTWCVSPHNPQTCPLNAGMPEPTFPGLKRHCPWTETVCFSETHLHTPPHTPSRIQPLHSSGGRFCGGGSI